MQTTAQQLLQRLRVSSAFSKGTRCVMAEPSSCIGSSRLNVCVAVSCTSWHLCMWVCACVGVVLVCMLCLANQKFCHRLNNLFCICCVKLLCLICVNFGLGLHSCCTDSSSCAAWKSRSTSVMPYSNFCQFPGQFCTPSGQSHLKPTLQVALSSMRSSIACIRSDVGFCCQAMHDVLDKC